MKEPDDASREAGRKPGERSPLFFSALDLIMVGAFHFSRWLVQLIPPRVAYALADLAALAGLAMRPRMRRRLLASIADALPEAGKLRTFRIALGSASMFFKPMPAFFLFGKHKERYMRELRVEGLHHLEEADAQGKGVLILCTHVGPFVLLLPTMTNLGFTYTPVTYKAEATPLPRYLTAMQWYGAGLGCDHELPVIFPGDDTSQQIREALARGKRVGITVDAPGSSVVDLFGRPAGLGSGMAHFVLGSGAPIVPAVVLDGRGSFRRRLVIYPPLTYELTGDKRTDIAAIMRAVAEAGERQIREDPSQWLSWFGLLGMRETAAKLAAERAGEARGGGA
jgi:Kdo2-lipid IVA lauroyltransferase/acyltransferase